MSGSDIRFVQRFNNYKKAFSNLKGAVELSKTRELSDLEKQGLIQAFEFTHELAWKTMKDFLEYYGTVASVYGSRDATRESFKIGLINNGDVWMDMIVSRNKTVHTYDEDEMNAIYRKIVDDYTPEFTYLKERILKEIEKTEETESVGEAR
ncbi:nucleotidyltransferase substrate binding protein [Methanoplanus endosymbiosus]|uniref:Nucleotidyltransferase substrate binding protein n=1 Tax=Methanoplanus endosymbiosus TaxID=33865 RepID=A0A9E7TKU4_9EURY|nr:nucleotidyltransferase substrate binding protein [Methanoplanus endosymbiosus]UUX93000.1 nucleotidyltransferase substrate binding protein [Methanoplanus endosymbiosus]